MSSPFRQNVTFPVGRVVWGKPGQTRDKDRSGKPLTTKDGKPRIECAFGVAFEKLGTQAFWQTPWGAIIYQVGRASFPHRFDANGHPIGKFSFKVVDGDSTIPNENGTVPNTQEGYAGHWVVTFKSSFVPKCYVNDGSPEKPVWREIDPSTIKTGDYIEIAGSVDSNGDTQKPGVYVNHGLIAHAGTGKEIVSGPDVGAVGFGKGPKPAGMGALPTGGAALPGSSPTPAPAAGLPAVGAAPGAAPAASQQPLPLPTPTATPAAGAPAPTTAAPTTVVPHTGILGAGAPVPGAPGTASAPAAPTAAPAAPPAGPVMTAKANGVPWSEFLKQNWTEDAARREGYIV